MHTTHTSAHIHTWLQVGAVSTHAPVEEVVAVSGGATAARCRQRPTSIAGFHAGCPKPGAEHPGSQLGAPG